MQPEAEVPALSTRFTSESAREAVRKRWDKAREAASKPPTEAATGASGDADVARGALLRIVSAKGSADAAVVSAARTILEQAGALAVPKPRTTTALEGMADAELDALLRLLEVAHPLHPGSHGTQVAHALPAPHTPSVGAA